MKSRPRHASRAALCRLLLLLALAVGARPAGAAIRIDISGVDGELRRNVQAMLSLERYKERERIEPDAIQRLYRRVPVEVRDALRPFGYYSPQVDASLAAEDGERNWRVQISIDPGEPVLITTVNILVRGGGADDPVFARVAAAPELRAGERLEHAAYEKVKSDLQAAATTYGYLDARLVRNELQVDPEAHQASVFLEIETGERYRFGTTSVEQSSIRESQLRRYLRYRDGEPFDAGKLLRTQFALDDSQIFSTVEVTTGTRDASTHLVPISIRAIGARNTYSFGAGYGTDTGVRGTVSWLNPRVNDRGHRLRATLQASQAKQNLVARYDMPFGDPVLEKFSLQFVDQTQQISSSIYTPNPLPPPGSNESAGHIDTREISLTPSITASTGRWQRVLAIKVAHDVTSSAIDGEKIDDLVVPDITIAAVPEGYLGEDLFSRSLYAELLGSSRALHAQADFLRLDVQSERVINLSARWHVLLRGEVGTVFIRNAVPNSKSADLPAILDLPATYRFFAGGDRSVRGFALDELSPLRTDPLTGVSQRVGGRHLVAGTLELERDLPRNLGVAAFTDFGNALDRVGDPLAISVGLGFRWRLPVITVGIDVAKALRAPGYLNSIGQPGLPGARLHLNISPKL
jgi:translocation and assembly module TamA